MAPINVNPGGRGGGGGGSLQNRLTKGLITWTGPAG